MENRFMTRITRMLRHSLGSCHPQNIWDEIDNSVFVQPCKSYHHHNLKQPKTYLPFSSICIPKCSDATLPQFKNPIRRPSNPSRYFPLVSAKNDHEHEYDYNMCPPTSPASPFHLIPHNMDYKGKDNTVSSFEEIKKNTFKMEDMGRPVSGLASLSSNAFANEESSFGSEQEEETESDTIFSTTTVSSESSKATSRRSLTHHGAARPKPMKKNKVPEETYAVVKSSSDPYHDFRSSMVEMIVERRMLDAEELEQLLECYLSLNSVRHHQIIIEVFAEIWDALFCPDQEGES